MSGHTAKQRRNGHMIAVSGFMCILFACLAVCAIIYINVSNAKKDSDIVDGHNQAAALQNRQENERLYRSAVEYNTRLAQSGQPLLGLDPFAPASQNNALNRNEAEDYLSQLDKPADAIMATVSYPQLGIKLPVYHGTASEVLEKGVGHMTGTSLPVGGVNTHAVISAHTGLADRQLFDALQVGRGAQVGDVFYIRVLDRTLAYKVTSIDVIAPDDFDALLIHSGRDEVTLLTCTPYGINTRRLLVTGERALMPSQAPYERDAPKDMTTLWHLVVAAAVLIVIIMSAWFAAFRRRSGRAAGRNKNTGMHVKNVEEGEKR